MRLGEGGAGSETTKEGKGEEVGNPLLLLSQRPGSNCSSISIKPTSLGVRWSKWNLFLKKSRTA